MSDNWIVLIPVDPAFAPTVDARRKARELISCIAPSADEITDQLEDTVRFIDCGANHEQTTCPTCRASLDEDWWSERMAEDFDDEHETFRLHPLTLPCCGARHNLNELCYSWPQGFTRYSLEAMNPDIGELPDEDKVRLESALGCHLRVVYQHI